MKETGLCVPKDGATWGLCPRVMIGEPVTNPRRRKPLWGDLIPALSCASGESVVINVGRSPFSFPPEGYRPLCEMVQADARLGLQVYSDAAGAWEDVRQR